MQKKYLIPTVLFIIIILSLVGSIAYKQFNKSPFTDNEQIETLAPKETDEIKVKSESKDLSTPTLGIGNGDSITGSRTPEEQESVEQDVREYFETRDNPAEGNGELTFNINDVPEDVLATAESPQELSESEKIEYESEIEEVIQEISTREVETLDSEYMESLQDNYRNLAEDYIKEKEATREVE